MYPFDAPHDGLRSFEVFAESERTVSANLIVQGEKGWYTFQFVDVQLSPEVVHMKTSTARFDRTTYHSKAMYVQFPAGERLVRWWVNDAVALGDKVFGWDARGDVQCSPEPGGDPSIPQGEMATSVDPTPDPYLVPPGAGDAILSPKTLQAPAEMTACAKPFVPASVVHAVSPPYPEDANFGTAVTTKIKIAVKADGTLVDAWIYQPTGFIDLDVAAMKAAKLSTYRGGTALCKPAPGMYLFSVTFTP